MGARVVQSETEASQRLVLMLPSQVKIEKEKVTVRASKQVPGRLRGHQGPGLRGKVLNRLGGGVCLGWRRACSKACRREPGVGGNGIIGWR